MFIIEIQFERILFTPLVAIRFSSSLCKPREQPQINSFLSGLINDAKCADKEPGKSIDNIRHHHKSIVEPVPELKEKWHPLNEL